MNNKQISEAFSKGNFEAAYVHFSENIQWNIIGDQPIKGKENVIAHCQKMLEGMDGTLSNTQVIEEGNSIAIEGNCNYTGEDGKPARVDYCDIYSFEDGKIVKITSYCISIK